MDLINHSKVKLKKQTNMLWRIKTEKCCLKKQFELSQKTKLTD